MASQQQATGALFNALTAGSKIIGTIVADSDIRVDGTIDGTVECSGKIVIGEKGYIKGDITCLNAEILGRFEGKINTRETLALRATAQLHGEVKTRTLIVEPNAVFNGSCEMGKPAAAPQK